MTLAELVSLVPAATELSLCCCCERSLAEWDQVFPDGKRMGVCGRCAEVVGDAQLVPRQRRS